MIEMIQTLVNMSFADLQDLLGDLFAPTAAAVAAAGAIISIASVGEMLKYTFVVLFHMKPDR